LFPNLYKLKAGENPIKDINVFKTLSNLKKLELQDTDAAKGNYREQLFKLLKGVEVIDGKDNKGEEVDSTIYDDEDDEGDELDDEGEGMFVFLNF
jgi:hypothetical protein